MRRSRPVAVLLAAVALSGCGGGGASLLDQVRDGGHVLLVRHTETARGGVDDLATLGDCDAQRPLTERGRDQARELGAALRTLEVPVGRVLASPFCRTTETAELAFGAVTPEDALLALASVAEIDRERILAAARVLVASPPDDGTNTVLVTHVSTIEPLAGTSPDEGGTVVLRPDGDGRATVVGTLPPGGWTELVDADR